jgi:hypothetical protein
LHWIPEAGRELYFVINHNLADPDRDNTFESTSADVTAKINYTFRFRTRALVAAATSR